MDSVDILDSRECVRCGMPMHMHPTAIPSWIDGQADLVCTGLAPESTPLPFVVAPFRDEDQIEWHGYWNEKGR